MRQPETPCGQVGGDTFEQPDAAPVDRPHLRLTIQPGLEHSTRHVAAVDAPPADLVDAKLDHAATSSRCDA